MHSFLVDVWHFIKNPIVLMFLFLFGFIQMIVILATLSSSNNFSASPETSQKPPDKSQQLDWRFKTAIKVEIQSSNSSSSSTSHSDLIQYGSEDYQYPLLVDMLDLVEKVKSGHNITVSPINDPQFPYLIRNENLCSNIPVVDLLILIKSAPGNSVARDAIRATWGKLSCWGNRSVRRAFLLGHSSSSATELQLNREHATHSDLVQAGFQDHYYNNTHKLMLGLHWATSESCRNAARFLMFVDDDYFVQPRAVLAYLDSVSAPLEPRLFSGYVWRMAVPQRNPRTKWFVDRLEYPWPFYPSYCSAGNFFLSMQMARDVAIAMRYTRFLRFDDVFLGIVLHKLLVVPLHLGDVFSFNPITNSSPRYRHIISSHGYKSPRHLLDTWLDLGCSQFCVH